MEMHDWTDLPFFYSTKFKQILLQLHQQRQQGILILPAPQDIFKAYQLTPFDSVKVVILGQDPYPNQQHPIGLAFAVPNGTKPLPPSLRNILQELHNDLGYSKDDCDLVSWAQQGVLLLNTSLTVVEGKPDSHKNIGWHSLIRETIEAVSSQLSNIVFILWGNNAIVKSAYINDPEKHLILTSAHPSPLAAHRGFFGSKPFSKCNLYLESCGKSKIYW
jgi:uracil-DNA glycosylase